MKIGIIGTGYVGLVTGVGFALKGHDVLGLDVDNKKVEAINNKNPPFFELGLKEGLERVVPGKFAAITSYGKLVDKSEVIFICVDTPTLANGEQDLSRVKACCSSLGEQIANSNFRLIVVKSTVLPGTTRGFIAPLLEKASSKKAGRDFEVAFNPEFLQEGNALNDVLYPDRIVIGVSGEKSEKMLFNLYGEFGAPIQVTTTDAAEMIKYASNCFLPMKISFMNEIGAVCKKLGIDTYEVAKGIGMDKRIGPAFLRSGLGWGGSCFPKETAALVKLAQNLGVEADIVKAVILVNNAQPGQVVKTLKQFKAVKKVGVLGLAFKPDTDDIRNSQAIPLVKLLVENGYVVSVFDPRATDNFKRACGEKVAYLASGQDVIDSSDAVIIATEWKEFEKLEYGNKVLIDARNAVPKEKRSKNYCGLYW